MSIFNHPEFDDHIQVAFCHDPESGLKAIIAIHNLKRGPALGGCRMWPYASEEEAITDVLRLSRGMTYKAALANLPYGGGKSVIIGDPKRDKTEALFRAMGRFVETLAGRYTVAEDVGISVPDVEIMARETHHTAGTMAGGAGDPSPATAYGVFMGIRAGVKHRLGRDSLDGISIAVQGLGHVGAQLCRYLADAGATLLVSDLNEEAIGRVVQELGAERVTTDEIHKVAADVYAPCALGAVINDRTIEELKVAIVAGSANNQLAEPRHGADLMRRNILYAPDYAINAGGIIALSHENHSGGPAYDPAESFAHVAKIQDTLLEIFEHAEAEGIPTSLAADRVAEQRFKATGSPTLVAAE